MLTLTFNCVVCLFYDGLGSLVVDVDRDVVICLISYSKLSLILFLSVLLRSLIYSYSCFPRFYVVLLLFVTITLFLVIFCSLILLPLLSSHDSCYFKFVSFIVAIVYLSQSLSFTDTRLFPAESLPNLLQYYIVITYSPYFQFYILSLSFPLSASALLSLL